MINMDNVMQVLLSRLLSLIADEPDIDIVPTKFGYVALESMTQEGLELYPSVLADFEAVCRTLISELEAQISAAHGWRDMTEDDAAELRRRAATCFKGLDKASRAWELLESFISHALSLAYHENPSD